MSEVEEKDVPVFVLFVVFLGTLACEVWALTILWRWHVEPLIHWALPFWPALGFWALAQQVKHTMWKVSYKSESNRKTLEKCVAALVGCVFTVAVGWIALKMR